MLTLLMMVLMPSPLSSLAAMKPSILPGSHGSDLFTSRWIIDIGIYNFEPPPLILIGGHVVKHLGISDIVVIGPPADKPCPSIILFGLIADVEKSAIAIDICSGTLVPEVPEVNPTSPNFSKIFSFFKVPQ